MKKIFYESRQANKLNVARNNNHVFPAHFHQDIEVFILRRGEYTLSINEDSYVLTDGTVAVVDSYDVHAYSAPRHDIKTSDDCVVIIPYRYLTRFNARRRDFKIAAPVIADKTLCDKLLGLADEFLRTDVSEALKEAAVELFLALLSEKLQYAEGRNREESVLIRKILAYIQENYRGEISLESTAKHLGYTTAHVSRAFHRYVHVSLPEYVNDLRMDYIERMRAHGDKRRMVDLVFESGFKSQQTYYRCRAKRLHTAQEKASFSTRE